MKNRKIIIKYFSIILLVLCFSLNSCGYRFSRGRLPEGVKSICIQVFANNTGESGIEVLFTNDVIYEFMNSGNVKITGGEDADAILSGTVKSMRIQGITHDPEQSSLERRVTINLDLKFENKTITRVQFLKDVSESQAYKVESDKSDTENNRRDAIEKISKRLAATIYNRLTSDF
jgi:hypothetical protein